MSFGAIGRILNLREIGNAENKTDRIQYIGFTTAVQTSNGGEVSVPITYDRPLRIRFESINDHLFEPHGVA